MLLARLCGGTPDTGVQRRVKAHFQYAACKGHGKKGLMSIGWIFCCKRSAPSVEEEGRTRRFLSLLDKESARNAMHEARVVCFLHGVVSPRQCAGSEFHTALQAPPWYRQMHHGDHQEVWFQGVSQYHVRKGRLRVGRRSKKSRLICGRSRKMAGHDRSCLSSGPQVQSDRCRSTCWMIANW